MVTKNNSLNNLFSQYTEVNEITTDKTSYLDMLNSDNKKPTMEETHTRMTFLIENELKDDFNAITAGKWGLKTKLINKAIESMLKDIKNEQL